MATLLLRQCGNQISSLARGATKAAANARLFYEGTAAKNSKPAYQSAPIASPSAGHPDQFNVSGPAKDAQNGKTPAQETIKLCDKKPEGSVTASTTLFDFQYEDKRKTVTKSDGTMQEETKRKTRGVFLVPGLTLSVLLFNTLGVGIMISYWYYKKVHLPQANPCAKRCGHQGSGDS